MGMPRHVSDLKLFRWPHIVQVCFLELTFWAFHPETAENIWSHIFSNGLEAI